MIGITSIDNVYENDGIANLQMMLMGMNIAHDRAVREGKPDPDEMRIVGIVPEYAADGRLDRLNVVTVGATEAMDDMGKALVLAGVPIIQKRCNDEAAALANLKEPTLKAPDAS